MRAISIINLKGGVAKTISAVNIAHILATLHGKRVLLIDNDKQGNTSKLFGLYDYDHKSVADILTDRQADISSIIRHTEYPRLDVIPANMNLLKANMDVLLDMSRPQQTRLAKALAGLGPTYHFCVIDNAPDINMAVINALVASDDVMVPIKVDKFAFDGLEQLTEQIENVREFNPGISFKGCFLTMYQRNTVNRQGDDWMRNESPYHTFSTFIRKTTKVDESTFANLPMLEYAKNSTATKDYIALVDEYLKML